MPGGLVLSYGLATRDANKLAVEAKTASRIYRVFIDVLLRLTDNGRPALQPINGQEPPIHFHDFECVSVLSFCPACIWPPVAGGYAHHTFNTRTFTYGWLRRRRRKQPRHTRPHRRRPAYDFTVHIFGLGFRLGRPFQTIHQDLDALPEGRRD